MSSLLPSLCLLLLCWLNSGEDETNKSKVGNNISSGENKRKAPCKGMYKVMDFMINPEVLTCWICHKLPKDQHSHLYLCDAGHVFCSSCTGAHMNSCGGSSGRCHLLENMASQLEIKCACGGYFRCNKMVGHHYDCRPLTEVFPHVWKKCKVKARFMLCSICGVILQTPIFEGGSYDRLICGNCHKADANKSDLTRCPDIEYLIKRMMVKTVRPFFRDSHPDVDETRKSVAGNNGETKGNAPSKVGQTDRCIVDGDEETSKHDSSSKDYSREACEEEDESVKLDTGKRLAKSSLKTAAAVSTARKQAKIAMTSGKKTGSEACIRVLRPRRR